MNTNQKTPAPALRCEAMVRRLWVLAVGTTCVGVNFTLLCINPNNPAAPIGLALGITSILLSPQGRAALARSLRRMADSLSD